jgi:YVTN family beta-propeller protein
LFIAANILLLLLFLTVLLGGSINEKFREYASTQFVYASPLAVLLVILGWMAKWLVRPHLPGPDEQKKIFRATLSLIRKLALRWKPAAGSVVLLAVLAGTQVWAVDDVCSPDPMPGSYGADGIVLSVDERILYLPDANNAGIAVFVSEKALNKIGASYHPVDTIRLETSPQSVARTPDGLQLYAVNNTGGTVSIVDLHTHTVAKTLNVGNDPRWIAVSPKGDRIYVSNVSAPRGSISVIDVAKQDTVAEITGVNCPEGLALSPDGGKLYVASQCGAGHDPMFVVDTNTNQKIAEVPGLAVGNAVIVSKDGKKAYVTRANFHWYDPVSGKFGAPLSIVDTATNRIIKTFVLQISASGLALTPDGKYVLVTNGYRLSVIDTQTDELVNNLSLRGYGNAITVRSDNTVIVSVSDRRRFVMFPLKKALSPWPCSSI